MHPANGFWRLTLQIVLIGMTSGAASGRVAAQPSRLITLAKPTAELNEPFTSILSIRELSDGRVIISDSRDKVVQLADFRKQQVVKIGTAGAGPGEYKFPQRLYSLKSDSTLLHDIGNDRYLLILPNGKPGPTRPAVEVSGYRSELIGVDNIGRLYFKASPTAAAPGPTRVVLRYNAQTKQLDSVATLMEPVGEMVMAHALPGGMLRFATNMPYVPRDVATVTTDGAVIVARVNDYHIEWFGSKSPRMAGAPVAYTPIAITAQERRTFMERQIRPGAIVSNANPNAGRSAKTMKEVPEDPGMTWPANIPPFLDGALSVDGSNRVWVKRTVVFSDPSATYDVFDATARRVLTVKLPPKAKLVGFGRGFVYLVRIDEDDLQYLQRYAAP